MRKQMLNKIVSILLVLAVCSATVFGCLITVNAADGPSYEITNGAVSSDLTTATADVTFTVPNGMVDGMFTVNKTGNPSDAEDCFASVTAVVKGGTPQSGTFSAEDFSVTVSTEGLEGDELALILFESADVTKLYTSVTFEFTFTFAKGTATKGASYAVSVAGFDFSGSSQNYNSFEGTAGVIETGCDHIITIDSSSVLIDNDTVNGYSVYSNAVCTICGERFDYQVVPNAIPLDEKTLYWDGSTYTEPTDDDGDGVYIIDTAAKLAFIACRLNWGDGYETYGKTFKVADGITAIVLQPEALSAIKDKTSAAEVKAFFEENASSAKNWSPTGYAPKYPFQGTFDGNGVTIYGLYSSGDGAYHGLFGTVDQGAVIKNVAVKNSYFYEGTNGMIGAIFANTAMDSDSWNATANKGTGNFTIENCASINNYMYAPSTDYNNRKKFGVLIGSAGEDYLIMKNCIAYGNDATTDITTPDGETFDMPLIGALYGGAVDVNSIENVIAIGATPYNRYDFSYATYVNGSNTNCFKNVYTDQPIGNFTMYNGTSAYSNFASKDMPNLTKINATDVLGTKAEETLVGFDFDNVWAVDKNGGYPLFAKYVATINQTENIIYNVNNSPSEGTFMTDGSHGTGAESDPYIIDNVSDLIYIVKSGSVATTQDKYFKIDDSIDAIVLQSEDNVKAIGNYFSGESTVEAGLAALKNMTAAQAKEYFTSSNSKTRWWTTATFAGNIDFNGVTVYGLYGCLFKEIYAGSTIKNLTVKGAYVEDDYAGVIADQSTGNGVINIENCTIANSTVVCKRKNGAISSGGVMVGACPWNTSDTYHTIYNIDNCLVYGNSAKHQGYYKSDTEDIQGYDITYGLFGSADTYDSGYSTIKNSIILDCVPHATYRSYAATQHITYSNVYTNVIGQTITNIDIDSNGTVKKQYTLTPTIDSNGKYTSNITEYNLTTDTLVGTIIGEEAAGSIIAASKDDVSGVNARNIISTFAEGVWSYDGNGGYPTPLAAFADTINNVSSRDLALKAVNLTYENSGNFSINLHYEPAYAGLNPVLYVTKSDSSKFMKLSSTASSMAGNGLSDDAIMYTIPNLSARDIDDALLSTTVSANVNTAVWGKTEQISIKDYAVSVIGGEAVYTDGATNAQKQADKNVAAAVINYGEAANSVTSAYDGASAGTVLYWDGTYTEPTTQDAEGNYIIDSAAKLAYLACKTQSNKYETYGKSYKVADGIEAIVLQPESLKCIKDISSAAEVKAFFDKNATFAKWWSVVGYQGAYPFQGTFDGNGVTVYGIYANWASYLEDDDSENDWRSDLYAGLFGLVDQGATIKNVSVKNSYFSTKAGFIGSIFANSAMNSSSWNATENIGDGTVTIENCISANNYMYVSATSSDHIKKSGVLLGSLDGDYLTVNNCMACDNDAHSDIVTPDGETHYLPLISNLTGTAGVNSVSNVISIGTTPYNKYNFGWNLYVHNFGENTGTNFFNNVYTDQPTANFYMYNGSSTYDYFASKAMPNLTNITAASVKGSNAAETLVNFDWNTWAYGSSGNYPTFAKVATTINQTKNNVMYYTSGDYDSTFMTSAETGVGDTAENPYIINTVSELIYLAKEATEAQTTGKFFKIADGIDAIVLQSSDSLKAIGTYFSSTNTTEAGLVALENMTASQAKEYYASNGTPWYVTGKTFAGTIDFNGATIYGLKSTGGGLFSYAGTGATFKNLAVTGAYVIGDSAGVIAARGSGTGDVIFENCTVANSSITSQRQNDAITFGGILIGYSNNVFNINNCLVYGNIAKHQGYYGTITGYDITYGLFGSAGSYKNSENQDVYSTVQNSIILDCVPHGVCRGWTSTQHITYSNVYTNVIGQTIINIDFTGEGATKKQITITPAIDASGKYTSNVTEYNLTTDTLVGTITGEEAAGSILATTADDLKGESGATVVDALNTANGSTVWYTGNTWSYPGLKEANLIPIANQLTYDNFDLSNYDVYTATDPEFSMYATSLSLKTNPYMGFTFAFHGDYKTNRDKITVTFKNAAGTVIKETTVADENGNLNAGWTNNANAGRYHLYKLTDVAAKDLCSPITVIVNYNGTDYEFGKFSAEGFALDAANAYRKAPCTYYTTRYEAAKALLFYTEMLEARYGAA